MSLLISPTSTFKGKIKAQGQWPEINYVAKTALYEVIEQFLLEKRDSGKQTAKVAAEFLHKHLVSWDVKENDTDTETVAITPEVLRRLPHPIIRDLINAVQGYSVEKPDAEE